MVVNPTGIFLVTSRLGAGLRPGACLRCFSTTPPAIGLSLARHFLICVPAASGTWSRVCRRVHFGISLVGGFFFAISGLRDAFLFLSA